LTSSEDFAQQISDLTESEIVLAPDLIVLETISGMYNMSLRKEISNSLFNSLFMQVAREDIKLIPSQDLISNIDELLGSITAYDASYVNLARKLNIPLCTSDKKLSKTASQYCDVICYV
jgi:predicted nucleic acid-binding protein